MVSGRATGGVLVGNIGVGRGEDDEACFRWETWQAATFNARKARRRGAVDELKEQIARRAVAHGGECEMIREFRGGVVRVLETPPHRSRVIAFPEAAASTVRVSGWACATPLARQTSTMTCRAERRIMWDEKRKVGRRRLRRRDSDRPGAGEEEKGGDGRTDQSFGMEHQKRSGAACAYVLLELTVTEAVSSVPPV